MELIEDKNNRENLDIQLGVILEESAASLTQGGYGGPIPEGNTSLRLWN